MFEIVVYLLDENYREEIKNYFSLPEFFLHFAEDTDSVISFCRTEILHLILVWPATEQTVKQLLTQLQENGLDSFPVVAVVKSGREFHSLCGLPLSNIFRIPMPRAEFSILLRTILEKSTHKLQDSADSDGYQEESGSLLQSLSTFYRNQDSALISVNAGGHVGRIYVDTGRIVRTNFRALTGMDALRKLSGLQDTDLNIHYTPVNEEEDLRMSMEEVLDTLRSYRQQILQHLASIGKISNKFYSLSTAADTKDKVKKSILEICRNGESIVNLLAVMNEDNLIILEKVRELVQAGELGSNVPSTEPITTTTENKKPRKFLSGFFKNLRKRKRPDEAKTAVNETVKLEEVRIPDTAASHAERISELDENTAEKIRKFLSEA